MNCRLDMEQASIDDDLETLEQWYTEYMTQNDPTAIHDASDSEALDLLEASEAETLQLTRDIDVTDGFCSTCHTMLNNWPDFETPEERRVSMTDEIKGSIIRLYSPFTELYPGSLINHDDRIKFVLPCQGQIVRLDSAARKGCRFCGLTLQTIKDSNWLALYRIIERRLRILGKPSKISLVVDILDTQNRLYDCIQVGFPGRLFPVFASFNPPTLMAFHDGKYCQLIGHFRGSNLMF